jgi:hypothetical protein
MADEVMIASEKVADEKHDEQKHEAENGNSRVNEHERPRRYSQRQIVVNTMGCPMNRAGDSLAWRRAAGEVTTEPWP